MPASNRRPLWDDRDAPQPSDTAKSSFEAMPVQPSASSTPAAADQQAGANFKQPCTFKGAASALYAGMLGYFLGVVPATIKFKGRQWGMIHTQGLASAQQLGIMSGMYTAVHCICQRIRLVEDGWNRGIAGCSTGLVLGWSNGPWSAVQSCAGLGLISALIDLGGGVEAAEARVLQPVQDPQHNHAQQHSDHQHADMHHKQQLQADNSNQQLLAGIPQPAQLLALLLGAPPSSMSMSSAGSSTDLRQHNVTRQHHTILQQLPHEDAARRSKTQHGSAAAVYTVASAVQHKPSSSQHQQPDTALASAAALLQPAARAVQQLMAAPPIMFLGACCASDVAARSGGSIPVAAAAAAGDVDACPVQAVQAAKQSSRT